MSKPTRKRGINIDALTFHDLGGDLGQRHDELAGAAAEEDLKRSRQSRQTRRPRDDS